jgi:hypothetical protein
MPLPNDGFKTSYPQYMVFYYLTRSQFDRYSKSNLCPPCPARDGISSYRTGGGICLVNLPMRADVEGLFGLNARHLNLNAEEEQQIPSTLGMTGMCGRSVRCSN